MYYSSDYLKLYYCNQWQYWSQWYRSDEKWLRKYLLIVADDNTVMTKMWNVVIILSAIAVWQYGNDENRRHVVKALGTAAATSKAAAAAKAAKSWNMPMYLNEKSINYCNQANRSINMWPCNDWQSKPIIVINGLIASNAMVLWRKVKLYYWSNWRNIVWPIILWKYIIMSWNK